MQIRCVKRIAPGPSRLSSTVPPPASGAEIGAVPNIVEQGSRSID